MSRSRRVRAWGSLSAAVALAGGCAEELHPEHWETTHVSGIVTQGGVPVTNGWVEFSPADGTVGTMRSARLGRDGRFRADGVAVGVNRVGIAGRALAVPEIRRCFDPLGSPILRTVRKSPSAPIVIELLDEYAVWQASRPPDRPSRPGNAPDRS